MNIEAETNKFMVYQAFNDLKTQTMDIPSASDIEKLLSKRGRNLTHQTISVHIKNLKTCEAREKGSRRHKESGFDSSEDLTELMI